MEQLLFTKFHLILCPAIPVEMCNKHVNSLAPVLKNRLISSSNRWPIPALLHFTCQIYYLSNNIVLKCVYINNRAGTDSILGSLYLSVECLGQGKDFNWPIRNIPLFPNSFLWSLFNNTFIFSDWNGPGSRNSVLRHFD